MKNKTDNIVLTFLFNSIIDIVQDEQPPLLNISGCFPYYFGHFELPCFSPRISLSRQMVYHTRVAQFLHRINLGIEKKNPVMMISHMTCFSTGWFFQLMLKKTQNHNIEHSEKKTEDQKPLGKVINNCLTTTSSFRWIK